MKNNIIFLLLICLLFMLSHLNTLEATTPPKCSVTIKVEDDSCSHNVSKGVVKVDRFIQDHIDELEVPQGKRIYKWDISKCKVDVNGCIDSASLIVAILITEEEALKIQDSAFWARNQSILDEIYNKNGSGSPNGWDIWQIVALFTALLLSVVSLLVTIFFDKKRKASLKNDVVDIVRDSDRLKEWRDEIKVTDKAPIIVNTTNDDIRDLKNRVADLEDTLRKAQTTNQNTDTSKYATSGSQKDSLSQQKMLYADSIVNGKFTRVKESPGDDSIFELKLKGDSHACVTIYKPAHQKVLANPSFLEGCEKQLLGNTTVSVVREGEAQKNDNGKWIVTTPLKVKVS